MGKGLVLRVGVTNYRGKEMLSGLRIGPKRPTVRSKWQ